MIELLKHQQEAVDKFSNIRARLVGDSMGVGKTVTGLGLDFDLRKKHGKPGAHIRTLIICQKSGLSVWRDHLLRFGVSPGRVCVIDPGNRDPFAKELAGGAKGYDYYVVHWDVLTKLEDLSLMRGKKPHIQWDHVIADEVHLAKNKAALRTRAFKKIKTHVKTGLSGTPADDKPQDLWSVLNWLWPHKYTSYWKFWDKYIDWELGYSGYRKMTGVKNMDEFHKEIHPFYIRRTLADVRESMPPKTHSILKVPLTARQARDYEQMRKFHVAKLGGDSEELIAPIAIAVRSRLQQMAAGTVELDWSAVDDGRSDGPVVRIQEPSPKLETLFEIIETHEDESFVVFTNFLDMANLVEARCQRLGIPVGKFTGQVTSKEVRDQVVSDFQSGKSRVFVGTIGAAGTSITLNRAHTAIFLDRHWNPSKNAQAEDRIYRIDNDDTPVQIIDIVSENTVDELKLEQLGTKVKWLREFLEPRAIL